MAPRFRRVIAAHGLEGSPNGAKILALRAAGLDVIAPDGRGQPLGARMQQLVEAWSAYPNAVLVGSSYGGLAALGAIDDAMRAGHDSPVAALVLLAPALMWRETPVDEPDALRVPASMPCAVIHGIRDTVVDPCHSEAFVLRCPHVQYLAVDDDHRLSGSLPLVVSRVKALCELPS